MFLLLHTYNVSRFLFLIVSLLLFLLLSTTEAAPSYRYHICGSNTTIYTPNSTYNSNLNRLLSSLSSNANRTTNYGFSNATAGLTAPDIAYGLYLCRGDVTADICRDCMGTATTEITDRCPEEREAVIWYDECLLRYSNQSFVTTVDISPSLYMWNTENVTEPTRFQQVMGETMVGLAELASNDSPNDQFVRGFGTREANFSSLQTVYGMVQCTPDLSGSDCNRCLRGAIGQLPTCCDGKQGGRVLGRSCSIRYEMYPFYRILAAPAPPPTPVLLPLPPPPPISVSTATGNGNSSSTIIIAIVAPIGVLLMLLALGYCYLVTKAKKKYNVVQEENVGNEITDVQSLQYDLDTIEAATNNFSDDNKIGEGGFGMVYKGALARGQEIAVKRLSRSSGQGTEEFKNEVVLLAKLQHRNLVRLFGFCLEGEERILVYEYVPNKSLDYFVFDPEKQGQLDWSRRYKIIGGIARGMLYLHEDSRLRIIHRDLKASNILLDTNMNAKISDFGMAKIFGVDQTQGNTSRIVGTHGYMSPEYAMHGQFSVKSDVFSFGVLVLEIISGKKNSCFYQSDLAEDLLCYAWKQWRDGTPMELMDPTLRESYSRNEVMRCIHIGLLCVQEEVDARPSMASIVLMLNSYSVTLPLPHQPPFFLRSRTESQIPKGPELDKSTTKSMTLSVDEESITQVYPR